MKSFISKIKCEVVLRGIDKNGIRLDVLFEREPGLIFTIFLLVATENWNEGLFSDLSCILKFICIMKWKLCPCYLYGQHQSSLQYNFNNKNIIIYPFSLFLYFPITYQLPHTGEADVHDTLTSGQTTQHNLRGLKYLLFCPKNQGIRSSNTHQATSYLIPRYLLESSNCAW